MNRIEWRTLILLAILVFFLYVVRSILSPFIIAAVLAYVFSPVVDQLQTRFRLGRVGSVAVFTASVAIALGGAIYLLGPILVRDIKELLLHGPELLVNLIVQATGSDRVELFGEVVDAETVSGWVVGYLSSVLGSPGEAFHLIARMVTSVAHVVLAMVLLVYFLLDRERIASYVLRFVPREQRDNVGMTAREIHLVIARYVRGQLALILLMSTVTFLGLTFIFHMRYALPIAIATGLLEIVPLVGPITAGAIAAMVGFVDGGLSLAIGVIVFYYVVRQFEDHLIVPNLVGHLVSLHPVSVIFAVLAGGVIGGLLGMLLAVPVAAAVKLVLDRWLLPYQ